MSWQPRSSLTAMLATLAISFCALAQQPPSASPSRKASSAALDGYIKNFQFVQLATAIATMPASPERNYFAGVLANRENHLSESIRLLDETIPLLRNDSPKRAAIALHSLADDYVKSYRYKDAISAYRDLLKNFAAQLDDAERQSARDDYQAVLLLNNVAPQTISFAGSVDLRTHRNPVLGTIDTDLTVNGIQRPWILDTGANFSAISASFARRLGLKLLDGTAQTQGITGDENKLRVAVLPEMKLGTATVRSVVLLVLEDSSLNVPTGKNSHYQVEAVLGYPVLQALERITFTRDGHLLGGAKSSSADVGARLFMNMLTPMLQCQVDGQDAIFSLDTGADRSFFSVRYRSEFAAQMRGLKEVRHGIGGAGGSRTVQAYLLPQATLGIGTAAATLASVPVLPALGTDSDKLFGNLGRDLTDPYSSFTIDFTRMRFELGDRVQQSTSAK